MQKISQSTVRWVVIAAGLIGLLLVAITGPVMAQEGGGSPLSADEQALLDRAMIALKNAENRPQQTWQTANTLEQFQTLEDTAGGFSVSQEMTMQATQTARMIRQDGRLNLQQTGSSRMVMTMEGEELLNVAVELETRVVDGGLYTLIIDGQGADFDTEFPQGWRRVTPELIAAYPAMAVGQYERVLEQAEAGQVFLTAQQLALLGLTQSVSARPATLDDGRALTEIVVELDPAAYFSLEMQNTAGFEDMGISLDAFDDAFTRGYARWVFGIDDDNQMWTVTVQTYLVLDEISAADFMPEAGLPPSIMISMEQYITSAFYITSLDEPQEPISAPDVE